MKAKKIVTIGGGTGSFTVLSGLRAYPDLDITAIVAMSDDGGSTGKLRDEYGVLPPGDIRQCLVALSDASKELRKLFSYRFSGGSMHGQNVGNILISGAEKAAGSFDEGLELVHKILTVRGRVVPVCLSDVRLVTTLGNGRTIRGQYLAESLFTHSRFGVQSISFEKPATANPAALKAIRAADLIIVGPGSVYSSLIPNFIPTGMKEALRKSKAKKVFIANLMNKFGDTDDFTVQDHVAEIEKYAGAGLFDYVIYNTRAPAPELVRRYKEEGRPVTLGVGRGELGDGEKQKRPKYKLIGAKILAGALHKPRKEYKNADLIRRTLIRHDPAKLAKEILKLV